MEVKYITTPYQSGCYICGSDDVSMYFANTPYVLDMSQEAINNWSTLCLIYRQVSNIRRTKSQHLKDSRVVLRLSLPNPLKPDVKSRMKM